MERKLDKKLIEDLKNSPLWINHLKKDCEEQKVFLAIRKNEIDFYYKGGRLFKFDDKGFATHIKYAAVIEDNGDYLSENELGEYKLISDFSANYERIKENCALYSGIESLGVSAIYHNHSYLSKEDIVVLDIEVSFDALTLGERKHD
jgi:hypothetical protein